MTVRGPVSAHVADDALRYARRHGTVVWLDRDGHYSALVADLAQSYGMGEITVPVVAHTGSFLETLFALEGKADGTS